MAGITPSLLIVDDEIDVAHMHQEIVQNIGFQAFVETDSEHVLQRLQSAPEIQLILLDIRMPRLSGIELLARLRLRFPHVGVIMASVIGDIDMAVQAIKNGAYNYLLKPLQPSRVKRVIESYFENRPTSLVDDPRFSTFITQDPKFEELFSRVRAFAQADVPVLIEGETGTGKELVAHLLHTLSARSALPFVAVNVAAIPRDLFEAELFGHVKGAFTGALRARAGYFEEAGGGTIFLDEFGELEVEHQKKLLRVLQDFSFRRVGEPTSTPLEARVVVATNRNLSDESAKDRFRADLYYRLSGHTISLPPLRKRKGDIALLADFFLRKYTSQYGRCLQGIHPEALACLQRYPFPGNVRELEGCISAAVLLESSPWITSDSLPDHIINPSISESEVETTRDLEEIKRRAILSVLRECGGNQTRASEELGIARGTLNRLIQQFRREGHRI